MFVFYIVNIIGFQPAPAYCTPDEQKITVHKALGIWCAKSCRQQWRQSLHVITPPIVAGMNVLRHHGHFAPDSHPTTTLWADAHQSSLI